MFEPAARDHTKWIKNCMGSDAEVRARTVSMGESCAMSPRRFPRFELVTLVLLTPFGSEEPFTAYSVDVSEGGMLLRTEKTVKDGMLLEFCSSHFAGECEVMWSHRAADGSTLFGIRFTSLGPRAHEELDMLLSKFRSIRAVGSE
jgi:hypothetical protein